MKKILIVFMIIFMAGCSFENQSLQQTLIQKFDEIEMVDAISPDNRKPFYSYYKEPSIGRRAAGKTYNVFVKDGTEFIMNLNVSKILNSAQHNRLQSTAMDIKSENYLFILEGRYKDYLNEDRQYVCSVYQSGEKYYIIFNTDYMTFYGSGTEGEIRNIAPEMLKLAKTVAIDQEEVISAYVSKEIIEYEREQLQLYDVMIPENGRIEEMMGDRYIPTSDPGDVDTEGEDGSGEDIDENTDNLHDNIGS